MRPDLTAEEEEKAEKEGKVGFAISVVLSSSCEDSALTPFYGVKIWLQSFADDLVQGLEKCSLVLSTTMCLSQRKWLSSALPAWFRFTRSPCVPSFVYPSVAHETPCFQPVWAISWPVRHCSRFSNDGWSAVGVTGADRGRRHKAGPPLDRLKDAR